MCSTGGPPKAKPGATRRKPAAVSETLTLDRFETPIGTALLVTDAAGRLCALDWADYEERLTTLLRRQHGVVALRPGAAPPALRQALADYFEGHHRALDTIACRTGGTAFQQKVWTALRDIPAGTTMSYGALAARLGMASAVRAVGHANGANPISIVVPCHRLIGADGRLTGYGGGLARKRWLLAHESVRIET